MKKLYSLISYTLIIASLLMLFGCQPIPENDSVKEEPTSADNKSEENTVDKILRQELGFGGVIITDSLSMGAITDEYTPGEAAIKAIEAGCDILLTPESFEDAFNAVVKAVEDGNISEQRIDESVRRILTLKQAYGLIQ